MNKETIEKAIDARLDEPDNQWDGIFNSGYSRGFKEGAEWCINSVWHDGREMPGYKRDFIYQAILKSGKVCFGMKMLFRDDEWDFIKKYSVIERWAYVDDLLPNRKEERQ